MLIEPTLAVTIARVPEPGAVYSPLGLTLPLPAVSVQVKPGCVVRFAPNWSCAVALSCAVAVGPTLSGAAGKLIAVTVGLTVTVTLELFDSPAWFVMVAWNV